MEKLENRLVHIFSWILGLIFSAPLIVHAYLGVFSRYIADDFCTAGSLREIGLINSQIFWYTSWSGRYSFTFVVNLLESLGPWIAQTMPAVVLLAWFLSLAYLIRQASRAFRKELNPGFSLSIAALIEFAILSGVGNTFQSVYWLTGIVTYSLPLIIFTFYLGWFMKITVDGRWSEITFPAYIGIFSVSLLTGGFSETFASVQLAAILGILVFILIWPGGKRKRLTRAVVFALIGAIASITIILVAPGNAIRAGGQPDRLSIFVLLGRTWLDFKIFVSRVLKQELIVLFLAIITPAWALVIRYGSTLGQLRNIRRDLVYILLVLPIFTGLLIMSAIIPYEYGISSYPDDRVLVVARAVLYMGIAAWSVAMGALITGFINLRSRSQLLVSILICVLLIVPGLIVAYEEINSSIAELDRLNDFAESWDERDDNLRGAYQLGVKKIEARSLTHMGKLAEIGYDPDEWINRCIAQTYGLDAVIAK
jgi:hypothetical protein